MSRILGVGIDIEDVHRFMIAMKRPAFLKNVYSKAELDYCNRIPERLAGRFAAKESVIKAISGEFGVIPMKDITILKGKDGKPITSIKGIKKQNLRIHLSISHTKTIAMAFAIAELV